MNPYKLHRLEEGPEREVETTKGELLQMFRSMYQVCGTTLYCNSHFTPASGPQEMDLESSVR